MRSTRLLAAATLAAVAFAARPALAQSSATGTITATAEVIAPISLSVTGATLNFNKIVRGGSAKVITPDSATSGRFYVEGKGGTGLSITITLPATLTNGAASMGVGTLTATAGTSDANGNTALTISSGSANTSQTLPGSTDTERLYFRIGATATPGAGTTATGTYSGTISISAAYTGI